MDVIKSKFAVVHESVYIAGENLVGEPHGSLSTGGVQRVLDLGLDDRLVICFLRRSRAMEVYRSHCVAIVHQ